MTVNRNVVTLLIKLKQNYSRKCKNVRGIKGGRRERELQNVTQPKRLICKNIRRITGEETERPIIF